MYPDEFTHRLSPAEYTVEDDNLKVSSKAPANLLIVENYPVQAAVAAAEEQ
jgi:hypothetical protein